MPSRYRNATNLAHLNLEDGYKLVPAVDPDWADADMRVAVVLESVDRIDLKGGTLYLRNEDPSPTTTSLNHVLRIARVLVKKATGDEPEFKVAVVNWNAAKTYHLSEGEASSLHKDFTSRVRSILKELKPTHVLVCGDLASSYLLPKIEHLTHKRGWVFNNKGVKWCSTLNIENLLNAQNKFADDDSESNGQDNHKASDLLFYVARNASNLLAGKLQFSVADVDPKPVYVGTIERFDLLYKKLLRANGLIGFDCETQSLDSYSNAIYTVQFAFNAEKGYVVPMDHPRTPFTEKERRYIKRKLKAFFSTRDPNKLKTFVTTNGAFDFRVFRAQLGINFIHHRVHELTAGEALLDENLGIFSRVSLRTGRLESRENLNAIVTAYGNDWYFKAAFSKQDRMQLSLYPADDPKVLAYCCRDACFPWAIAELQYEQAKLYTTYDYAKKKIVNYEPFFRTHLIKQMGATSMNISTLEQHGCHVDLPYMMQLLGEKSPLKDALDSTLKELRSLPNVQEANAQVSKEEGSSGRSLFNKNPFVLSFTKTNHKIKLFIDILGLKPLSQTKTGLPQIDRAFNDHYKREYKEVELYAEFQEITKLMSTYVRGWITKLSDNNDSRKDARMRARYMFFRIVTGRLGSYDPNLQQIPSRGKKAKIIKRMFVAPKGTLQIRADYSAHEVRFWAILASDKVLAGAFKVALELKQKLTQTIPGKERDALLQRLKKEGDLHLVNVNLFFGQWVDKSHPFRDLIKSTIFGLIYGMVVTSLARDRKTKMVAEARNALDKDKNDKKLQLELRNLLDKSDDEWRDESQEVVDKVYSRFKAGAQHLDRVSKDIVKRGWVSAPTGRRRNMYRVFSGDKSAISSAQRSSKNAPVQGIASEVGMRAAYLCLKECDLFFREMEIEHYPLFTRTVHDENSFEVAYEIVIPFLWIYQYTSMFKVKDAFEADYGFKWVVEPEVEVKISSREDNTHVWDWTLDNLLSCIEKSLEDQVSTGFLAKKDQSKALDTILEFARDPKRMKLLQKRYPLLNVPLNSEALKLLTN